MSQRHSVLIDQLYGVLQHYRSCVTRTVRPQSLTALTLDNIHSYLLLSASVSLLLSFTAKIDVKQGKPVTSDINTLAQSYLHASYYSGTGAAELPTSRNEAQSVFKVFVANIIIIIIIIIIYSVA